MPKDLQQFIDGNNFRIVGKLTNLCVPCSFVANLLIGWVFNMATAITDLDVAYRVNKQFTVSIGANNLFNIYPTQNIRSKVVNGTAFTGSDNVGIFPYSGISPFGFNGTFYYTKATYKF